MIIFIKIDFTDKIHHNLYTKKKDYRQSYTYDGSMKHPRKKDPNKKYLHKK